MMRDLHFNRAGEAINLHEWARLHSDPDYIRVAREPIITPAGPATVSTVWLGLDHNFSGVGPPIIFETMVFGGGEEWEDAQWRYSTEAEALAGHQAAIDSIALWVNAEAVGKEEEER